MSLSTQLVRIPPRYVVYLPVVASLRILWVSDLIPHVPRCHKKDDDLMSVPKKSKKKARRKRSRWTGPHTIVPTDQIYVCRRTMIKNGQANTVVVIVTTTAPTSENSFALSTGREKLMGMPAFPLRYSTIASALYPL